MTETLMLLACGGALVALFAWAMSRGPGPRPGPHDDLDLPREHANAYLYVYDPRSRSSEAAASFRVHVSGDIWLTCTEAGRTRRRLVEEANPALGLGLVRGGIWLLVPDRDMGLWPLMLMPEDRA